MKYFLKWSFFRSILCMSNQFFSPHFQRIPKFLFFSRKTWEGKEDKQTEFSCVKIIKSKYSRVEKYPKNWEKTKSSKKTKKNVSWELFFKYFYLFQRNLKLTEFLFSCGVVGKTTKKIRNYEIIKHYHKIQNKIWNSPFMLFLIFFK